MSQMSSKRERREYISTTKTAFRFFSKLVPNKQIFFLKKIISNIEKKKKLCRPEIRSAMGQYGPNSIAAEWAGTYQTWAKFVTLDTRHRHRSFPLLLSKNGHFSKTKRYFAKKKAKRNDINE